MAQFRNDLVAFEAPADWDDKTIVAFAAPVMPGKFSPNLVMTKDKLKPGETLRSYGDRQIMELARRLEGFDLVDSGERTLGGLPALEYRFSWISDVAQLHQHTVMTAAGDQILTFTGTAVREEEAVLDKAMEQTLSTVSFPHLTPGYSPYGNAAPVPPAPAPAPRGIGGGWTPTGR